MVFDAGNHPYADAILKLLTTPGTKAFVPLLWRYEASAVLARTLIKAAIPQSEVTDFIQDLEALPICLNTGGDGRIFTVVHKLAMAYQLTSYDAAYLELAQRRSLPLATLDKELIAACTAAGVPVLQDHLSNLS